MQENFLGQLFGVLPLQGEVVRDRINLLPESVHELPPGVVFAFAALAYRNSRLNQFYYDVDGGTDLEVGLYADYYVAGGWRTLYRLNHAHLSSPNVLRVGQLLRLP